MIVPFPCKPRVVITHALIASETEGGRTIRHDPPQPRFFLEFEEGEDSYIVWDGPDYLGAIEAAGDWLADGVEVRDRVAAPWGRA